MKSVLQDKDSATHGILYMAMELSHSKWKLGFSNSEKMRVKTIEARNWEALLAETALAKQQLNCAPDCQVVSCYEAGRDGFWIHRALEAEGIKNLVLDSASIEVSRRQKQVKTDRVDVIALLRLLMRFMNGEKQALNPIRIPTVAEEGDRRLHRERERLLKERGAHSARVKSLLITHGIVLDKMSHLPNLIKDAKGAVTGYDLPQDLKSELIREYERYDQVNQQIMALEKLQIERAELEGQPATDNLQRLRSLRGLGWQSSWTLVMEFFNWRAFKNAKQVGACAGLTPTPYDSGDSTREQGISKAGNKRVRTMMIELSWLWLRYQPNSELSQWFEKRFGSGGKRMRRIGIVALARKLLVALWRFLSQGVIPQGAVLKVV